VMFLQLHDLTVAVYSRQPPTFVLRLVRMI
jgi:hypothetical protein